GVLTEPATANEIGVELEDGGSVSFNKMNFDSGNNHAEFTAITSDSNGKILLYSDEQLVTTYNLINTNGSLVKFTSEIPIADIAKIAGIHDIKLKYEGSSPMILKTYRNLERNRLVTEETATTSKAMQIEDQAISIEGEFNVGTEAQRAYVEAADGSIIYLSKGALQVDRTKDSIVSFTVKSNGKADLHLQRDRSTTPFASISIPDTKGEWIKVSTNISNKYVNPDHYPTNLKSVFLSISADDQETKLRLDNYVLDPA
ncbi:carbohydrate-binding protein, partial [Paenibacillus sp. MCAF20]